VCGEGGLAVGAGDLRVARSAGPGGGVDVRVGVPLADVYLEFLGGRCRPHTVLAAAYDLKVFFSVVAKRPDRVQPADVLAFITAQRTGRVGGHGVLRPVLAGNEPVGVSAATVRRRLSIVSGFFAFLQARGDVASNPVPRGLPTRRERSRPRQGVPLVRATRQLPRILSPAEVDALTRALRTHRDRAVVAAMVLLIRRRGARPRPVIDLGLLHPPAQRLGMNTQLTAHPGQLTVTLALPGTDLQNHLHRAFTQLIRVLPLCRHDSASFQGSEPPRSPGRSRGSINAKRSERAIGFRCDCCAKAAIGYGVGVAHAELVSGSML
jgi:Phage integrase, N-terminal SAM-like domain